MAKYTQPPLFWPALVMFRKRKVTKTGGTSYATSGTKSYFTPTAILRTDYRSRTYKVRRAQRKAS